MIAALDTLGLFVVLFFSILFYRWLIHSRWFARLIGSVVYIPPETSDEVIDNLSEAQQTALERVAEAKRIAEEERNTANTIKRHIGPRSKKRE